MAGMVSALWPALIYKDIVDICQILCYPTVKNERSVIHSEDN